MVDHNVMRLDVTVHDALAVAKVQGLEQLQDVEADIDVGEFGIQRPEIGVVDALKDERGRLALRQGSVWCPQTLNTQGQPLRTCESRTTSRSATMLGPPDRFCRILISRLIFFFFTGLSTLMTHFW